MANLASKITDQFSAIVKAMTQGVVRVKDTRNVDSQISRGDLEEADSQPAYGAAEELITLGEKRFEDSRQAFWRHRAQFFRGIANYAGRQYQSWNSEADGMMPAGSGDDGNPDEIERMIRQTANVIRPVVKLAVSRVMAAFPDAWAAPMTDSEQDKACAQIARAANAHGARVTRLLEMIESAVLTCLISTTCFIERAWDNTAEADMGIPQADGSIDFRKERIGELRGSMLLAIDAYPDPNSSLTGDINDGAFFTKRTIRTKSFIEDKWGKTVEGTCSSQEYAFLRQRLEYIAGDMTSTDASIKDAVEVTEVWEKPSKRFPRGRFWVYTSDKTLLWAGWWPYEKRDAYPFIDIGYERNTGSIWHLNMIDDMLDAQRQFNGVETYLYARQMTDRPQEYVPDGSNIASPDLLSPALGRTIGYSSSAVGGGLPTYVEPPAVGDFWFQRRRDLLALIDRISGVRDMNSDTMPPPNSGWEYQQRLDEDKSRLAPFIRHIEQAVVRIYEWDLALYRQYGTSVPRMLGLDDKAIPLQGGVATALADLKALRQGRCRVILQPGSGQSKTPAAIQEWLDNFIKTASQANVAPPLLEFYLEQCQWIRSDSSVDKLLANYKVWYQQQQQQAMQLQQQKGDQATQQLQMKAQQEQRAAQIEEQSEQVRAAIQVDSEAQSQKFRLQTDQANEDQRARNTAAIENMKFEHAMALQSADKSTPNVSITAPLKLGPTSTADAERKWLQLTPDDVNTLKTILAPPKPAAASGGGKPSGKQS